MKNPTCTASAFNTPGVPTLFMLLIGLLLSTPILAQDVFINEIHYDNTGGDKGEAVEVTGPAGTSLAGWTWYTAAATAPCTTPCKT